MIKRLSILALVCLVAVSLRAQTQADRLQAKVIANRDIPVLVGQQPSVALGNVFATGNNGTIVNFTNGFLSQRISIICADSNTSIADTANIITQTGSTLSCAPNTIFEFILYNGGIWDQSGTSTGGGGGGGSTPGSPTNSLQRNGGSNNFLGDASLTWNGTTKSLTAVGDGSSSTQKVCGDSGCVDGLQVTETSHTTSVSGTNTALSGTTGLSLQGASGASPALWPNATPSATGVALMPSDTANPTHLIWSSNFINGLSATLGTLTTDVNPFNLSFTYNNPAQVFNGVKWVATDTAYGAGSMNYQWCGGTSGDKCFTLDPLGRAQSAGQMGSGDGSAAGNIQFLQGPLPTILPNNVGLGAPSTVDAGGAFGILPGSPCSGILSSYLLSAPIYQIRCSNSAQNKQSNSALIGTATNVTLCSTANCPAGDYEIKLHVDSNQTCAVPNTASIAFTITFTDDGGTKTNQTIPISVNGSAAFATSMVLGDLTHNASGSYLINSTGVNPITFTATVIPCTSGTAQASYKIEAVRF
jgi:hypothetical protein